MKAPSDQISDAILKKFHGSLHAFFILDQQDVDFRAYVFVPTESDLAASATSGVRDEIVSSVYEELDRVGLGTRADVTVAFEFDSDERVKAEYGNYYNRLL
jgi:hypothetical protein